MDTHTLNRSKFASKSGINKYQLLQSDSDDIRLAYEQVFSKVNGSLTTVVDNDSTSKFNVAINSFSSITPEQLECIKQIETAFVYIERQIDPNRLYFSITRASDNEICINRSNESGLSKIIVHEDGLIALSFIAFRGVDKPDSLAFYEEPQPNYESIVFRFFA